MIEHIDAYFVLSGVTIGFVLVYLWLRARSASHINVSLIRLNEELRFDTLAFLREAWGQLSKGGLNGIEWQMDWFGTPVYGKSGVMTGKIQHKEIRVAELKLRITLYQQRTRGERHYFNETLIATFLLLLRTDMWIKIGATNATFAQMAKLNLFLQHDMKNIAQFIQLMADQLAEVPAGKEQQVIDHLRVVAPLIRHRADRIVRTLTVGQMQAAPMCTLQLDAELAQMCQLYYLDFEITGSAEVEAPENTIDSALDNILKNYSDIMHRNHKIKPVVCIDISKRDQKVEITIGASKVPPVTTQVERMFEPFWSSDPAGLGIGLYQAKQLLEMCQGDLQARRTEDGQLHFRLEFPARCEPIEPARFNQELLAPTSEFSKLPHVN
jgi:signal transduction histidine kinase